MSTFDGRWRELQLQTLVDLSLSIGGVRSEEDLVEELLHRAVGTLDARGGAVVTRYAGGRYGMVRTVGIPERTEAVLDLLGREGEETLDSGRPVHLRPEGPGTVREVAAAPMASGGETLGFVLLVDKESREGPVAFREEDIRFLGSLASLGAAALRTARTVAAIERDRQRLAEENRALRDVTRQEGFIGESAGIREMLDLVRRVAPTDAAVMLRGESGVGKERVARLIHGFSERAEGPFVPLDCAALPETLLEAELFGIEEGVATGVRRRMGKIELAAGGTLFLDEVGDLPLGLQAKLLRVVQERELERLGGRERIPVDLRLVTATHRDLEAMVRRGEFRSDLYYRLRVVVIPIPPLRERRTDIPLLARHFLEVYGQRFGRPGLRLSREAMAVLMAHDFPGNVRELENLVQAAVALSPGDTITVRDLLLTTGERNGEEEDWLVPLREVERRHIERVLRSVGGNRRAAARILGIDRSTLYRKMKYFASHDASRNDSLKSR